MSDVIFAVIVVLAGLLVFSVAAAFIIISSLVNKLLSRNYFEYLDSKKNLKKPKTETVLEERIPQENIARVF
jgi:hypothetical protein